MKKEIIYTLLLITFVSFACVIIYNLSFEEEIDYFNILESFADNMELSPQEVEKIKNTSKNELDSELKKLTENLPKDEETIMPEKTDPIFLCNQETESKQLELIEEKKDINKPCNMSIQKKFMFSCNPMNAFPVGELDKNVNLLEDPSQYYKNLHKPIKAVIDDFEYLGANLADYSNFAKIKEVGRIQLDANKVHPVPQNVIFRNSPAFDFV